MATALIVYASLTGNTEEIADILAESLEEQGVEVDIKECTSATADEFHDYDICVAQLTLMVQMVIYQMKSLIFMKN